MEEFMLCYPNMRISRFAIKMGETVPLHIHAHQFGLVYVLAGLCHIKTYNVQDLPNHQFELSLAEDRIYSANQHGSLTPRRNAHVITALQDTIFLDIFAPGAQDGRLSTFLAIINSDPAGHVLIAEAINVQHIDLPSNLKSAYLQSQTVEG